MTDEAAAFQASPCLARGAAIPDGCRLGDPAAAPHDEVILWGDSHAAHLAPALDEIGRRRGLAVREIAKAGCPPIPGAHYLPADAMRSGCAAFNQAAMAAIRSSRARIVVVAANWDIPLNGDILLTRSGIRPSLAESRKLLADGLRQSLIALAADGRRIILVGQTPVPTDVVDCLTRALLQNRDQAGCQNPMTSVAGAADASNRLLTGAARGLESQIQILHPYEGLCDHSGCNVTADGSLLYMDATHLSAAGARRVCRPIEAAIASTLGR